MEAKRTKRRTARKPGRAAKTRKAKSLAELAAQQGITVPQDFDALFGAGAKLWKSDAEFEKFVADLREARRKGG
jgi:hypothetical protein